MADMPLTHACTDAGTTQTAVKAYNESGIPTPIKGRRWSEIEVMTYGGVAAKP
jgi:hypothetical protein